MDTIFNSLTPADKEKFCRYMYLIIAKVLKIPTKQYLIIIESNDLNEISYIQSKLRELDNANSVQRGSPNQSLNRSNEPQQSTVEAESKRDQDQGQGQGQPQVSTSAAGSGPAPGPAPAFEPVPPVEPQTGRRNRKRTIAEVEDEESQSRRPSARASATSAEPPRKRARKSRETDIGARRTLRGTGIELEEEVRDVGDVISSARKRKRKPNNNEQ